MWHSEFQETEIDCLDFQNEISSKKKQKTKTKKKKKPKKIQKAKFKKTKNPTNNPKQNQKIKLKQNKNIRRHSTLLIINTNIHQSYFAIISTSNNVSTFTRFLKKKM